MKPKKHDPNWGGSRPGSGRKPVHGEPTVYIGLRLPESLLAKIDQLEGKNRTDKILTALKSFFSQ